MPRCSLGCCIVSTSQNIQLLSLFGGFTADGQISSNIITSQLNDFINGWNTMSLSTDLQGRFGLCCDNITNQMNLKLRKWIDPENYSSNNNEIDTENNNENNSDNENDHKSFVIFGGVCAENDFNEIVVATAT